MSVRKMTELKVKIQSEVGELAHVLGLAEQAGASISAFCGYEHDYSADPSGATILLVPDKPDKVTAALEKAGYKVDANPVVSVTGAVGRGMASQIAKKIAEGGMNILYSYASSSGDGQSVAIFRVLKPDEAIKALKAPSA